VFALFAIDASIRPAGVAIDTSCTLDETSAMLFDTHFIEDGFYAVPSDETMVMRWAEDEEHWRTLIIEVLPLEIALGLTDGIESYFEHLVYTRFELNDEGRAVSIISQRFGEAEYGLFGSDVVRQATITLAALEAAGLEGVGL
jgi:hypothetical protein